MKQNSLIEIGSKANIVIRFKSSVTINGYTYQANEPYLYLKDANILISYTNQDKTGTAARTLIANSDIKPRTISIGGVSFSRKIASLLSNLEQTEVSYNPTVFRNLTAQKESGATDGYIFLVDDYDSTKDSFVYDLNFNPISFTYDETLTALVSPDFVDGEDYIISFSTVKEGTKFDLNKPAIPYMSLEIQAVGNIDKKTKNVMMYFDKVSLNSVLQFNFFNDGSISAPLEFHIIDDKDNYIVYED